MRATAVILFLLLALAARAEAEPRYRLRMAVVAPRGSSWAREVETWTRDVERASGGAIQVKVYFGAVTGDDIETGERVERGQLDGILSGGGWCERVMPTIRVQAVTGLFQNWDESRHVLDQLRPTLEDEARKSGYALTAISGLGPSIFFTRKPVTTMAELRATRLWRWEVEMVQVAMGRVMGLQVVPLKLLEAGPAYDAGKVDGFSALTTSALAFQWYTRTPYYLDLTSYWLFGCVLVHNRVFDAMPPDLQKVIVEAGRRLEPRFEATSRRTHDVLVSKVFPKQGLKRIVPSPAFRAEFFEAARRARDALDPSLIAKETLERVLRLLADYRSEHP